MVITSILNLIEKKRSQLAQITPFIFYHKVGSTPHFAPHLSLTKLYIFSNDNP